MPSGKLHSIADISCSASFKIHILTPTVAAISELFEMAQGTDQRKVAATSWTLKRLAKDGLDIHEQS
jgi:hypothetical protein